MWHAVLQRSIKHSGIWYGEVALRINVKEEELTGQLVCASGIIVPREQWVKQCGSGDSPERETGQNTNQHKIQSHKIQEMLAKKQPVWSDSMRNITAGYRKSTPLAVGPVKGVRRGFGMTILTVHSEKRNILSILYTTVFRNSTCFTVSTCYSKCMCWFHGGKEDGIIS